MTTATDQTPMTRAEAAFVHAFGCPPEARAFAPGRANLIGDHTDYCDGYVLPLALSIGCACAAQLIPEPVLEALACDLDERASVRLDSTLTPEHLTDAPPWFRYVAGVVAEVAASAGHAPSGLRLTLASSVPVGSGLSSSAAVEVSVATAIEAATGVALGPLETAKACQRAEHRFAGVPCGLMDQLVSVCGQEGSAVLIDCRDGSITPVPLPDHHHAQFVLLDTGVRHSNASGAYAARRSACESAAEALGVSALRDVPASDLDRLPGTLSDAERDAVHHVVTENNRVLDFARAMRNSDYAHAGHLLDQSHRSLSEVYRVSCTELDELAAMARAIPGVLGARMTGGGFGGWVVALAESHAVGTLIREVESGQVSAMPPMPILAGPGAHAID